jgi:hypothetical protein
MDSCPAGAESAEVKSTGSKATTSPKARGPSLIITTSCAVVGVQPNMRRTTFVNDKP